jgi:hypothetical protein
VLVNDFSRNPGFLVDGEDVDLDAGCDYLFVGFLDLLPSEGGAALRSDVEGFGALGERSCERSSFGVLGVVEGGLVGASGLDLKQRQAVLRSRSGHGGAGRGSGFEFVDDRVQGTQLTAGVLRLCSGLVSMH